MKQLIAPAVLTAGLALVGCKSDSDNEPGPTQRSVPGSTDTGQPMQSGARMPNDYGTMDDRNRNPDLADDTQRNPRGTDTQRGTRGQSGMGDQGTRSGQQGTGSGQGSQGTR